MTIKDKLIFIIMLACIAGLMLAGTTFIIWEQSSFRSNMARVLSTRAAILAENCKSSLAFQDAKDAENILRALHVDPSLMSGTIFDDKNECFAAYYRDSSAIKVIPIEFKKTIVIFNSDSLVISSPIVLDDAIIGTICLQSDLSFLHESTKRGIQIMAAVIFLSSLAVFSVSSRLQKVISGPILSLAEVAKTVSEEKDYSARAIKRSSDEVGSLIDAFNEMLEQIQHRDFELVDAKGKLEVRVEKRTAELTTANEQLTREVAERKKAEQRQAQLLEQLEKINKELNDFAYVISHDLKAPLRGIKTLTEWITTDYADKLDENGKEQMNLLERRVDRMHNLIDGVLQYSRVGRVKEDMVQINLNELIPEVIDSLAPPENISITIETKLPTIKYEQTRIMQVFQNLLSNAIKYMDKPQGQIKIGCIEENGFWKFSVADNGPGIEEKYFEKIFQMFQTLAPRDESESTGVGLTVVKKIIEMYKGSVWVESEVGNGSTFFFTLPKQKKGVKNAKLQANIVS
jgi:signal transduction histidine kinase